jgi:hypothetical protein
MRRSWPEKFLNADVGQIAVHIAVEVRLGGDEDRDAVVLHRPAQDGGVHPAFADAGLVADDEALAALDVVDRERERIDLLGGERKTFSPSRSK